MHKLQKILNFPTMLLITINSIIGTGIFFLPALGALYAGPASLISWVILSFIAIYISMCFGELCSMYPTAGGVYEFCKHAYGRFTSFIIGWLTIIGVNITLAMLIVGAINYLLPFNSPVPTIIISILFILIFNFIAYRGMKVSATMLIMFAFITLITLFSLIIPGFFNIDFANFRPFFVFPKYVIFLAIFFIAETFFGWESPTFLAGETKDGKRVMPKALIMATVIISLISLVFVFVALGVVNWASFGAAEAPLLTLAESIYGKIGITIFTLAVYLSIIGSVADWVVSTPRLILSMAKDRLFILQLSKIHPKYHTPHLAIAFQTIVSIIFIVLGIGSYQTLLNLLVPILLVLYSIVLISVVILRIKKSKVKRYFKVPFGKIGPIIVALIFMSLLVFWMFHVENAFHVLKLGFSFILLGFPVYFLLEMYYNPRAVRKTNNVLAYLVLLTEQLALPKGVRREIIHLLGNLKNKIVLEFGCSVGTLTLHLAEEVGPGGKIYASDISERDLTIAQKRLDKRGHKHVMLYHDLQHHSRVHPEIPKINVIVSVGVLGYVQNVRRILKEMNQRLDKGNRICFVDYDKFFDLIPNIGWLNKDESVKNIFNKAGFDVEVKRVQGFAWKYIYIYGKKVKDVK